MLMEEVWRNRRDCSSHCSDCPGCDSPYPFGGLGDPDADVMLIGKEPAYNVENDSVDMDMEWSEAKTLLTLDRKASENPLWKHMTNVAEAAECDVLDLYFTNVAKCTNNSRFSERTSRCKAYLKTEIIEVMPKTILLHGSKVIHVVYNILGLGSPGNVGSVHGSVVEVKPFTVIPLYHWGYAYRRRNINKYDEIVADAVRDALNK